jgi:hypothetical protein
MFESDELSKDFSDVEKKNDVPLIVCFWGVKKVKIKGKIFLAAVSRDEREERKRGGPAPLRRTEIEELSSDHPGCMVISGWCQPDGGCKKCELKKQDDSWMCDCTQT